MANARLYRPSKSAMTSGRRNTRQWVLEFEPQSAREIDPLMGWTSTSDMSQQIRLRFPTKDEALAYAKRKNISCEILPEHQRGRILRSYADNFK